MIVLTLFVWIGLIFTEQTTRITTYEKYYFHPDNIVDV